MNYIRFLSEAFYRKKIYSAFSFHIIYFFISIKGSNLEIHYKGVVGKILFSPATSTFFGEIRHSKILTVFLSSSIHDAEQAFKDAVDALQLHTRLETADNS